MSLQTRLAALITAIGADIKTLTTQVATKFSMNSSFSVAPQTDKITTFTIVDDGSSTSSWPNRLEYQYQPVAGSPHLTFFLNEYQEARVVPAKTTTVPFRLFTKTAAADATHTAAMLQLMDDRTTRTPIYGLDSNGRPLLGSTEVVGAHSVVIEFSATTPPTGTPVGTVVFKKRS